MTPVLNGSKRPNTGFSWVFYVFFVGFGLQLPSKVIRYTCCDHNVPWICIVGLGRRPAMAQIKDLGAKKCSGTKENVQTVLENTPFEKQEKHESSR